MQLRAIQVLKLLAELLFELLGKGVILVVWFFRSRRSFFRRRSRFLLGGPSRLGRGGRFLVCRRNLQERQQSERGHGKKHPSAYAVHAGSLEPLTFWRAGGVSPLFFASNRGLTPPARPFC